MEKVVIDTNIFVSAILNKNGAPRTVLRHALIGDLCPIFGNALFREYEDVLGREELFRRSPIDQSARQQLFEAILSVSEWTPVWFLWRPNLPDEADNHLLELAIAGGASAVITANVKDFQRTELAFPKLEILNAGDYLSSRRLI